VGNGASGRAEQQQPQMQLHMQLPLRGWQEALKPGCIPAPALRPPHPQDHGLLAGLVSLHPLRVSGPEAAAAPSPAPPKGALCNARAAPARGSELLQPPGACEAPRSRHSSTSPRPSPKGSTPASRCCWAPSAGSTTAQSAGWVWARLFGGRGRAARCKRPGHGRGQHRVTAKASPQWHPHKPNNPPTPPPSTTTCWTSATWPNPPTPHPPPPSHPHPPTPNPHPPKHYYMLDFCYMANALLMAHIWLAPASGALARVSLGQPRRRGRGVRRACAGPLSSQQDAVSASGRLLFGSSLALLGLSLRPPPPAPQITFAFNTGPLLWSILAFRNSLVLHSLDKVRGRPPGEGRDRSGQRGGGCCSRAQPPPRLPLPQHPPSPPPPPPPKRHPRSPASTCTSPPPSCRGRCGGTPTRRASGRRRAAAPRARRSWCWRRCPYTVRRGGGGGGGATRAGAGWG
jgi:hypothetical protein